MSQANADAIKAAGSARGRRHNLTMRPSDALKPSVEYTRGVGEEDNGSSTTAKCKQHNHYTNTCMFCKIIVQENTYLVFISI